MIQAIFRAMLTGLLLAASPVLGQDFSGLARVDMAQSGVRDAGSGLEIDLRLTQPVPFRVFTLDEPRRLVVDFREVDWTGVSVAALLNADRASDLRFGPLRPGWSRLVVDLAGPYALDTAAMNVDDASGAAQVQIILEEVDPETFSAKSGTPPSAEWDDLTAPVANLPAPPPDDGVVVVVVDPGHGGIDPGAERDGAREAHLMLALGIELAEALNRRDGVRAVLTRTDDSFVPLEARMSIARAAGADLFISLHADALEEDEAKGASVYTLNADGEDRASERMAERHERGDLLAGLDLSGQDDRVATVLMDLARLESGPQGIRFANTLVGAFREAGVPLNSRPMRDGRLAVLNAADFASVLVEVGFLSSDRDREMLRTPEGRAPVVAGFVQAVEWWAADEAALSPLLRQ
jgi:N-acetylmuramoyl-L-alanine amidase